MSSHDPETGCGLMMIGCGVLFLLAIVALMVLWDGKLVNW